MSVENVGMFGNYNDEWKPIKVGADGKLDILATLDTSLLATSAKQDDLISAMNNVALDSKITVGSADLVNGDLQQVLMYGRQTNGTLKPLQITSTNLLKVEHVIQRIVGSQTFTAPGGNVKTTSQTIPMGDNQYASFFGSVVMTQGGGGGGQLHIQYSNDGVNFYQGAEDDSKIILITSSGEFYQQTRIITPYVRILRLNGGQNDNTVTLKWSLA